MTDQKNKPVRRVTAPDLARMKAQGEPITMLTAYDFHSARLADNAGVDTLLVGDSLGMTMLGYDSTLPVTMDDMVYATKIVARTAKRALVVGDLPFMSYQISVKEGMANAARLIKEGGAQMVKLETATDNTLKLISRLAEAGIPVMAHLGLTPQSVNSFGGYKTQGKTTSAAQVLIEEAKAVQDAGASALVLECIPSELAKVISETLYIPTIGIGAGPSCDGQVQVFHDLLGFGTFKPKHAKAFCDAETIFSAAIQEYITDCKSSEFPTQTESTYFDEATRAEFGLE